MMLRMTIKNYPSKKLWRVRILSGLCNTEYRADAHSLGELAQALESARQFVLRESANMPLVEIEREAQP